MIQSAGENVDNLFAANSPVRTVTAVKVHGISKMYRIYDRPQDRLKLMLFARFGRTYGREFWALQDISFEVEPGEALGIIGRNGSGKSTLLQIIAGTLLPTEGWVQVQGRVAALLELGSGFNPEYTGRENVYMNGAILGLSREEMDSHFSNIAAFADIGDFMDQPVRLYSSGMMVRLAFSVAVFVDPNILIIDEALAVGDIGFQQKCFYHLEQLRERKVTLLLVSHDIQLVKRYCTSAIYLDHGQMRLRGSPELVTEAYLKDIFAEHQASSAQALQIQWKETGHGKPAFGTSRGAFEQFSLWRGETPSLTFQPGDWLVLKIVARVEESVLNPDVTFQLRDFRGYPIYGSNSLSFGVDYPSSSRDHGRFALAFRLRIDLAPGSYSISLGLTDSLSASTTTVLEKVVGALEFNVIESGIPNFHGVVDLKAHCEPIPNFPLRSP